jgi:hypothetical protein
VVDEVVVEVDDEAEQCLLLKIHVQTETNHETPMMVNVMIIIKTEKKLK